MTILFLCEFPILFSTVKLKLGYTLFPIYPQIKNFDFEMFVLGCVYFQVLPNSWKRRKIEIFEKPRLHLQIFSNSQKSLKIKIFVQLTSYFIKWWGWSSSTTCGVREEEPKANLWLNYQFLRKNINITLYETILCQFKSWKYCTKT